MMKLYGHELSGNSYKAKLMLSLLGLDYEQQLGDRKEHHLESDRSFREKFLMH